MPFQTLWKDSGIQKTFVFRSLFQIHDSAAHFFNKIVDVGKDDYVPDMDDVMRCRVQTGIREVNFELEDNPFRMIDVV